ncbi:hypothetical protein IFR05_015982 [Cadophora sp. M221]|nr:hypothetical protein IFR05_015982 [Cadophora sp. M221]
MNRIARRLGPATHGTAIFHRRPHHVNALQHRAAFRCVHSGPNGQTGGVPNGSEASLSKLGGSADGLDGEGSSGLKPEESHEPLDQELSSTIHQASQPLSSHQEEPSDSKPENNQSINNGNVAGDGDGAKPLVQPVKPAFVIRKILGNGSKEYNISPGKAPISALEAAMKKEWIKKKGNAKQKTIIQRSSTIEYDFPEQATKENLLKSVRGFNFTATQWKLWAETAARQAVVILFTPGLAALVENDVTLVPDLLKSMTRTSEWDYGKPLQIDVVCACVDGLAPGPEMLSMSRGQRPKEGFSILHGLRKNTLHPLWTGSETSPSKSPSIQSSITLRKGLSGPPDVTLPLANTLFKNGRLSTLLVSRWQYNPASEGFVAIEGPVERTNVVVNLLDTVTSRIPHSYIPAVPLTPARPIVNGLGNIVRTVDFGGEEGIGPASRELESTVTEYLDFREYGNTTIDVWALIVPPESVPKRADSGLELATPEDKFLSTNGSEIRKKWPAPLNSYEDLDYIGYWIKRNAKFCRILSGGGGWGAKQGLLSLDPQTTYSEIPEARFDFSGGSLEEQQTSALGNIAQQGAYIQFFVASRERGLGLIQHPVERGKILMRKSAVFGAVPSTVDDIPPQPQTQTAADNGTKTGSKSIHVRRGHFGFVSESGMFVRHGPDRSATGDGFTKIDMPYSYFYVDYRDPLKELKESKETTEMPGVVRKVKVYRKEGVVRRVSGNRKTSGVDI